MKYTWFRNVTLSDKKRFRAKSQVPTLRFCERLLSFRNDVCHHKCLTWEVQPSCVLYLK